MATINSAAENQFLTNEISEISYIGLNDAASEGDFVWTDNSTATYTNFSDCSWCAANSADYEYYAMFPWDGSWNLNHRWTPRQYIVELDCDETTNSCSIQASTNGLTCFDNNTPTNINDDYFTFSVQVTGASNWIATFNGLTQTGTGSSSNFGPYEINQGAFTAGQQIALTLSDAADASCSTTTQFVVPSPCSEDGTTASVDLELSLEATPIHPGQWNLATTSLTILNTGTETAHNVVVQFFDQSDISNWSMLGFMGDVTPSGTDFHDWTGIWEIPSIAANESYTLEYMGFTKVGSAIPMFAQVTACDEQDGDSTPNNNTTQSPNEDDEALVILNQSAASSVQSTLVPLSGNPLTIFPNPAKNFITVALPMDQDTRIQILNNLGQVVYAKDLASDHEPFIQISLTQMPTGTYSVLVNEQAKRLVIEK